MKKFFSILMFIILVTLVSAENKVKLATFESALSGVSAEVLKEAYGKLNYEVEFVVLPGKRALQESNKGIIDGESHRVDGVSKNFPNLIQIQIPINYFELRAYSKRHDFYIHSKDDLKGYTIGIKRGVVIAEKYSEGLKVEASADDLTNFKKIIANRIDLLIITDVNAKNLMKKNDFSGVKMLDPALRTVKLYHYLHKKNADLAEKLTDVLEEMQASGEIDKIRNDVLNK